MRLYSFVNFYLSSIQQGIQTAHLVAELALNERHNQDFVSWATRHKTIVVLNGGNSREIADTFLFLLTHGDEFAISLFKEDEDSLNNAITCTGIVLPSVFCSFIDAYRETGEMISSEYPNYKLSNTHQELVKYIAGHKLAM
jgi:hypothetical protein